MSDAAMSGMAEILAESVRDLCRRHCDRALQARIETGHWPADVWRAVEDSGLCDALLPESASGPGIGRADALSLAVPLGEAAMPLPILETMLARGLLHEAGLAIPAGPLSLAAERFDAFELTLANGAARLTGQAHRVPYAGKVDHIVVLAGSAAGPQLALLRTADCALAPAASLADEPRDGVRADGVTPVAMAATTLAAADLTAAMAVLRSAQIAGALKTVLRMASEYAVLRKQFGRSLSRFQAIQHSLAQLVEQTAAAIAAADAGIETIAGDRDPVLIAAAKIRSGEAAGAGAAIAHQVLGAIGYTREHDLNLFTRRLWSWRDEYGNEAVWSRRLGRRLVAAGADRLWQGLTAS